VVALLGLLAAQSGTGLFANDDIDFTGPLAALVDSALSSRLTGFHHLLSDGLIALMALHVIAIVFYVRFKKENLVKPMVTGWKDVPSDTSGAVGTPSQGGWLAFMVALLVALAAVYGASGATGFSL
jgi:cytochrome b